jgi:hypothetical protein
MSGRGGVPPAAVARGPQPVRRVARGAAGYPHGMMGRHTDDDEDEEEQR